MSASGERRAPRGLPERRRRERENELMIPEHYLEKVYAGFLGKCVGIRLGAPVEPSIWTMERIKMTYGYIDRYVKYYKTFAADDDSNGPAYFIRALLDDATDREPTPDDVARAWLNYAREGVGMFWWGGYGVSTEHTAYSNLRAGIPAPQSGSIRQNGEIIAQQIGGQIFIDTFGLVNPCDPEKAARYGEIAASVSHDGEGLNGARFFCAAISEAFRTADVKRIVEAGLSTIPESSDYYRVARTVMAFQTEHPEDFRACMEMLDRDWNMTKFPGNCHIIPNAGVCILALMYGGGDYAKTIEIACNCGLDTDCNAGNVGTVMGVACGLDAIPEKYRAPVNDGIVLSGISGYLNILDLPTFAKQLALIGYRIAGEKAPEQIVNSFRPGELYFDFMLPGSLHNFRSSDESICQLRHSDESISTGGSLEILYSQLYRSQQCRIFYKPFYTRDDFSDERYMPAFSPQVVCGQDVRFQLYVDQWQGGDMIGVNPYVHTINGTTKIVAYTQPAQGEWIEVRFTVPDTNGEIIDEVGFVMEGLSRKTDRSRGRALMTGFSVSGEGRYNVDFSRQRVDFGSVTPLVHTGAAWRRVGNTLCHTRCKESFSYTGNYYAKDQSVAVDMTPNCGDQHLLAVRAGGIERGYFAGLDRDGTVAIYKNEFGIQKLAHAPFAWRTDQKYRVEFSAVGDCLTLAVDGVAVLSVKDETFGSGMVGFGSLSIGRTTYQNLTVWNS